MVKNYKRLRMTPIEGVQALVVLKKIQLSTTPGIALFVARKSPASKKKIKNEKIFKKIFKRIFSSETIKNDICLRVQTLEVLRERQ